MRVISQNGTMDFPYEISTIFIYPRIENAIAIQSAGDSEISIIGRYSSKEKAIKAMEMLRTSYKRNLAMGLMSEKARRVFANAESSMSNAEIMVDISKELTEFEYFQFPQDDEIEV